MRGFRDPWFVAARWLAVGCLVGGSALAVNGGGTAPSRPQPAASKKFALLVGCTHYQNQAISPLWGPGNDIPLFADLLVKDFGFQPADVKQLVGWPDDVKTRPTYQNIVQGFEDLIAKATPGVQIVLLLNGHGVQVPIPESQKDPLDPKNPEPDGMDEVFLPADAAKWNPEGLVNAIKDDQIGAWLDQLRVKGAAVWVIFDCCHSGGLDRGTDEIEKPRQVLPMQLDIPRAAIDNARKRAADALAKVGKLPPGLPEANPLELKPDRAARGSVAIFFAAQPFETTPELPRPADAPRTEKHYFGLFTYTLVSVLRQRQSPLTYKELASIVAARYAAERGARGPTPAFDGDLHHEVLAARQWPGRSAILLQRDQDTLQVTAGQLRGLTVGSVLTVHPPAGDPRDPQAVLGHVKVVSLSPHAAVVGPCDSPAGKPTPADALLPLARCGLAVRDFGDLKLKLAVRAARAEDAGGATAVRAVLARLPAEIQGLYALAPEESEVLLWNEGGKVMLRPAAGKKLDAAQVDRGRPMGAGPHLFSAHATDKADALAAALERDLQTLFTWHNVWRVAGSLNRSDHHGAGQGLKLEVALLKDTGDVARPLTNGEPLAPGQRLHYRLINDGGSPLWVTILFLDSHCGIATKNLTIKPGQTLGPFKGSVAPGFEGREGMVVLAVSQEVSRERPEFDFLAQESLRSEKSTTRGQRTRGAASAPESPFGKLLQTAALGRGTRGLPSAAPTTPTVLVASWFTLPEAKGAKE